MTTIVSRNLALSVHQEHELLLRLKSAGLSPNLAQMLIESKGNRLAQEMVTLLKQGGLPKVSELQGIMGKNFFGIEDAVEYLGIEPTTEELQKLAEVPFSEKVLAQCADTHILVANFGTSIFALREKVGHSLFGGENPWEEKPTFVHTAHSAAWQLIRKTPVPESAYKTWEQQQGLLVEHEEVPSAQAVVYTLVGHFLKQNQRFFADYVVRCREAVSTCYGATVCGFDENTQLQVNFWYRNSGRPFLGLASSVKQ